MIRRATFIRCYASSTRISLRTFTCHGDVYYTSGVHMQSRLSWEHLAGPSSNLALVTRVDPARVLLAGSTLQIQRPSFSQTHFLAATTFSFRLNRKLRVLLLLRTVTPLTLLHTSLLTSSQLPRLLFSLLIFSYKTTQCTPLGHTVRASRSMPYPTQSAPSIPPVASSPGATTTQPHRPTHPMQPPKPAIHL
jgi:hypothetical protein